MSDYESRWNFHQAEEFPAPPAFRGVQKIYPSGSQIGNSYPAPHLQQDETLPRQATSPVVPQGNSNPTLPTSPSTLGGGKKAPPPRPPKKGTSSLTLSQAPSNDGAEQPLVSPVSPGERKSLPPVPGADKKLPPPLPKKQPNIVFHPPSNPPPNPGGPKKVPVTAPPKKVGTAPVPPKKMVTGPQAPPPPPPKKAGAPPPLPPKKTV
jgi:Wiskott-Aldrich syndrome protein